MTPRSIYLVLLILLTLATVSFPVGQRELFSLLDDAPAPPQRLTVLGYERDLFGSGWATGRNGCTTREELMAETYVTGECGGVAAPSRVSAVIDPYTGSKLTIDDVEIDHVFPLSAAWDMGAYAWSDSERLSFANDPRNLIATSRAANQSKSDQLPSEWLPPARAYRCEYATRVALVAALYQLGLPDDDRRAITRACRVRVVDILRL